MIVLKRFIPFILSLFVLVLCFFALNCWAGDAVFSITGQVKHPLNLSTGDLSKFQTVSVRINNINKNGGYEGVFNTQGVPLKSLLEVCGLQKEESGFPKPVDLAIVVRNGSGKQIVLSWGEVFFRNPAEVTLAFSAVPVMPLHGVSPDQAEHLYRKISFPKLVVAGDYYSDRSLEGVVNIEVVNLKAGGEFKKMGKLVCPEFNLTGAVKKNLFIKDLSSYPQTEIPATVVGEGRGFEGMEKYKGVPLVELLAKAGAEADLNTVFLATAVDGYRSLISYGELFLSPQGKRVIVADRVKGKPLQKNGKFLLILPDDLFADRQVKALAKIEVLSMKNKEKLYIIGVGPGDTDLITPEALSRLGRTDALVCPEDISRRYARYLGGKEILFDPMSMIHKHRFIEANPGLSAGEVDKLLDAKRRGALQKIQDVLNAGKNVAYLEWGDPLIFGGSRWIRDFFAEEQIETVPSISAFNVSNAIVERDVTCRGSVILTAPKGIKDNEFLLKSAAEHGDTLAIFMGLRELRDLMPLLNKYYKDSTPIVIVYNAGISRSEHLIRSTLKDVLSKTDNEQEKHLGMIYIGTCLATNGVR
ncbi:MAG: Cobalt-precorrin-4 C(11)-methyltransferase [Syntrophus sp. PtaB.Bin001]|nr:MAG: Cobalt-precorrin-4 C(11)-methyltransferase [Syntrophus sp. PtaB.Bin001]